MGPVVIAYTTYMLVVVVVVVVVVEKIVCCLQYNQIKKSRKHERILLNFMIMS